ncbi:MAG: hypothetical protein KDH16_20965 [Rhodocyclaceae bacterium]|nr:hypothetical protein [Rhodocyclaceae bacterium]
MPTPAYTIAIKIDTDSLGSLEDSYLAALWHAAQINPAPFGDRNACELAERIGREIIRRFLVTTSPRMWDHQAAHIGLSKTLAQSPKDESCANGNNDIVNEVFTAVSKNVCYVEALARDVAGRDE